MNRIADFAIDQAMHVIARIVTGNRLRTVAQGLENLPANGPAIIAARHYHHLFDGLAFFAAVERRFHIVVTLDWAQSRRSKFLLSTLNRLARWPMVLREDALLSGETEHRTLFKPSDLPRYQLAALRQSVKLLGEKRLLIIFPEGYPNIDPIYTPKTGADEFLPFKPGFAVIAERAERITNQSIPIIPAGITYQIGATWLAQLNFGLPVYRREFPSRQQLIEHVAGAVKQLCAVQIKIEHDGKLDPHN
ncbi:MAG: lysophospholipid acyltransferase family protein [Candidatus Binatia bacterium]